MSKCLELEACRYNAQVIRAPFVLTLAPHVDLRPICPEVEIGLGTPRDPIRLVRLEGTLHLVQPSTGRDVTGEMHAFSDAFLASVPEADGFILKGRSPSCGIKDTKVYGGIEAAQPVGKDAGLFGRAVLERFPHAAVEDEGRLTNFRLRHHFLTRTFARAAFRAARADGTMAALVRFHTAHKLMLMGTREASMRTLGRIVANADGRPPVQVFEAYERELTAALARPASDGSTVNVLMHAFGYVSDGLSPDEKRHFLRALDDYRAERVTLHAPLALLQSWVLRFDQDYLRGQTFLEPYPMELMDLRDSGRT